MSDFPKTNVINLNELNALDLESNRKDFKSYNVTKRVVKISKTKLKWWPLFSLFRYSTFKDKVLILIGTLTTIISSWSLPTMNMIFGQVVNALVRYEINFSGTPNSMPDNDDFDVPFMDHFCPGDSIETNGYANEQHDELICKVKFLSYGLYLIALLYCISTYLCLVTFQLSAFNQVLNIKKKFFASILKQDIQWFDEMSSTAKGEIKCSEFSSRISSDLKKIERGMNENLCLLIYFISSAVANVFYAFYYGWKLSLVIFSVTPVLIISSGLVTRLQSSFVRKELKAYGNAGILANEVFSTIRTVFAFGGETKALEEFANRLRPSSKSGYKRSVMAALGNAMTWGMIYLSFGLCIWYGIRLLIHEPESKYNIGLIITVFWCTSAVGWNLGYTAPYIDTVQTACTVAESIFATIEMVPTINRESVHIKATQSRLPLNYEANIDFVNVYFSYPSRKDVRVLDDLTLNIRAGEVVALVGTSGSGKSTCVQLLQRFYDVDNGKILLNGIDIKKLNVGWLREQFGVVGQEPVLLDLSIGNNILLGMPDDRIGSVTQKDIEEAAKEANAHEFITKLPNGYDSFVGERGAQLSGGQKQRIAIARALIKKPKILLLDEATSALDFQSESVVQAALDKASMGRTTIIIAHRLSTIINADRIICMDHGTIVEMGTHQELMERQSAYHNLFTTQIQAQTLDSNNEMNEEILKDWNKVTSVKKNRSVKDNSRKGSNWNNEEQASENADLKKDTFIMLKMIQMLFYKPVSTTLGVIFSLLFGCCVPLYAWIFGNFINSFSESDNEKNLNGTADNKDYIEDESIKYSWQFVGLAAFSFFTCLFQLTFFSIASQKLTSRLRLLIFGALLKKDAAWFDEPEHSVGNLCQSLASDPNDIQSATGSRIAMLSQATSTLVISIAFGFFISWKLSLVTVVFVPLIIVSTTSVASIMGQQSAKDKDKNERAVKLGQETINSIRTIVSLNKENFFDKYYSQTLEYNVHEVKQKFHIKALSISLAHCTPLLAYATTFLYGGQLIANHEINSGKFYKVIESIIFGVNAFSQSCIFSTDIENAKIATAKILRLLKGYNSVVEQPDYQLNKCRGEIRFQNVCFTYPSRGSSLILDRISFCIQPGQKVALVGASGCGKSTIIQLLERFYEPQRGNIYLDGFNIKELNINWLRSQISLVSQEPILFNCSIRQNIAYGDNSRTTIPMIEIIEVATKACIHDFIMALPNGYETVVGTSGCLLSGGQKQRIAIARALIRDPPILLLDEATSALDSSAEKQIQDTLDKVSIGRTCIIIAHRLSTIQNVDQIFYIERGNIVEHGTHKQLLSKQSYYCKLFKRQMFSTKN